MVETPPPPQTMLDDMGAVECRIRRPQSGRARKQPAGYLSRSTDENRTTGIPSSRVENIVVLRERAVRARTQLPLLAALFGPLALA